MTITALPTSVFAKETARIWQHRWAAEIHVGTLLAGTPADPKIIEGYLRGKMSGKSEEAKIALIEDMAQQIIQEIEESFPEGMTADAKADRVLEEAARRSGEIFKRDPERDGELYEEGRKVASMLKEAASIQWPNANSGRPAVMTRNAKQWWPEHVFVLDDRIYLNRFKEDERLRRVVHTKGRFGEPQSGFNMQEVLHDVRIPFTVASDVCMTDDAWAKVWTRAELGGFGATRSQGYGRFTVTRWEKLS